MEKVHTFSLVLSELTRCKGNLRVDGNVSVHRPGSPLGTRCEIKNINSVRFLQQAIGMSPSSTLAQS